MILKPLGMLWLLLLLLLSSGLAHPQRLSGGGEANPELRTNAIALEHWRELRFGMFIHWGPVALKGTEIGWSRGREVPADEYDRLYLRFNPARFQADEWVRIAKQAGMKYLVLVTKHHDGFSLWHSAHTEYDLAATPLGRDAVEELAEECRRQGLLFGTYYSILDWYHPDYPIAFDRTVPKQGAVMSRYQAFMKAQLRELVSRYGSRILWFDGEWEEPWTHEMGMELYTWLRQLDNNLLINNRVDKGRSGMEGTSRSARFAGDFETPEQRIGNYDTTTPWETCMTLGSQWAWKADDQLKSARECVRALVRTAGGDGNLLLNVGPMPDGRIEPRQAELLSGIGRWLSVFGETIYGTRGGPVPPQVWGVTTSRGNRVFVHLLNTSGGEVRIPKPSFEVKSARLFRDGSSLEFRRANRDILLAVPGSGDQEPDVVVELTVTYSPEETRGGIP